MPDVPAFQTAALLAEQAAAVGDFAGAEARLREALDLQESALGPRHPDLASTLNNLAVACEMTDKPADAEQFYRRAYAVAAAALGSGHPLVATSHDNLRDFCQARGLPFTASTETPSEVTGAVPLGVATPAPTPVETPTVTTVTPVAPVALPSTTVTPASTSSIPPSRTRRRAALWVAAIVAVLAAAIGARQWLSAPGGATADVRPAPTATEAPAPAGAVAPVAPVAPAAAAAPVGDVAPAAPATRSEPAAPADVRIVTATVCRTLSTSGAWRCEPAGATNAGGRLTFYTRIASPRPLQVRHRWYQDDRLRQDVALRLGANAREGFRTFSRHTVGPGQWRVELRADNGALLDEARFVVR